MSIEGQGHFLTIYFPGYVCTRPRYQVSVYRTIGPLVKVGGIITISLLKKVQDKHIQACASLEYIHRYSVIPHGSATTYRIVTECRFCLFVLWFNVPVNNFSVMSGRSHRFLGITSTFRGVNVSRTQQGGGRYQTPDLSLRRQRLYH